MLHYRFVKIDRTFNYNELAQFGSQTSLSANKGVNQQVMRFTPFITPKNAIVVLLCRIHYLHNQRRTRADIKLSRGSPIENI